MSQLLSRFALASAVALSAGCSDLPEESTAACELVGRAPQFDEDNFAALANREFLVPDAELPPCDNSSCFGDTTGLRFWADGRYEFFDDAVVGVDEDRRGTWSLVSHGPGEGQLVLRTDSGLTRVSEFIVGAEGQTLTLVRDAGALVSGRPVENPSKGRLDDLERPGLPRSICAVLDQRWVRADSFLDAVPDEVEIREDGSAEVWLDGSSCVTESSWRIDTNGPEVLRILVGSYTTGGCDERGWSVYELTHSVPDTLSLSRHIFTPSALAQPDISSVHFLIGVSFTATITITATMPSVLRAGVEVPFEVRLSNRHQYNYPPQPVTLVGLEVVMQPVEEVDGEFLPVGEPVVAGALPPGEVVIEGDSDHRVTLQVRPPDAELVELRMRVALRELPSTWHEDMPHLVRLEP